MTNPPAVDVFMRQGSRAGNQKRQSAPCLRVKMKDAVKELFKHMAQGAVNMGGLSACVAKCALQQGVAVCAIGVFTSAGPCLRPLNRPGGKRSRCKNAGSLDFACHSVPATIAQRSGAQAGRRFSRNAARPSRPSALALRAAIRLAVSRASV